MASFAATLHYKSSPHGDKFWSQVYQATSLKYYFSSQLFGVQLLLTLQSPRSPVIIILQQEQVPQTSYFPWERQAEKTYFVFSPALLHHKEIQTLFLLHRSHVRKSILDIQVKPN